MVEWTTKTLYINETTQISLGKFTFVVLITLFQFFGMLVDNNWVLTGAMFFLFANALFMMSKSTKVAEELAEKNEKLIADNKIVISDLKEKVCDLKVEIVDLKGVKI